MPRCEFCRIVAGELPARVVFEDDNTLSFFPLKPAALGHTLVVPKKHVPDLWSLELDTAVPLAAAILSLSSAIRRALQPDGMNVINSAGKAASQTIPHLHVHLVPRWFNDHIGNIWPPSEPWGEDVKDEVADLIRRQVG